MNCSFVGMNYLAHAYLSFDSPPIVVGNMISDFVKGAAKLGFSGKVQTGIMLHRHIDEFTDNHSATKRAKEFFRPAYRLYSGAVVDVLYDHFLANDASIFNETSLKKFSAGIYQHLELHTAELPPAFLHVFTYMRTDDWLFNYRTNEGMRKSLAGLVRRAAYLSESSTAYNLFLEHYVSLNECYHEFFKDVKLFAKQKLEELSAEF
jgi:acyl carrier protein phosphodiesterase